MEMRAQKVEQVRGRAAARGADRRFFEMPGSRTATSASWPPTTPQTMKELWSCQQRAPFLTAVLSTAAASRSSAISTASFQAVDVKTGKMLWQTRLGTSVQGFPSRSPSAASSTSP